MSLISLLKKAGANGFGFSSTAEEVTEGLDLTGKKVLITGVNSGLGLETARVLSKRGATVIGLARTLGKAESICLQMNDSYYPLACELSEPQSVLECVETLKNANIQIDALICNAGIMALPKLQQKYGIELQFLTNHIGHFILVNGLAGSLNDYGRVIVVSSAAHKMFSYSNGIQFTNFSGSHGYDSHKAYGHSKLANLLFSNELSRRFDSTNFAANAVHPGVIHTNLVRHYRLLVRYGLRTVEKIFLKTVQQGAATQCYVGVHSDLDGVSGNYFSDCNPSETSEFGQDQDMATRLWDVSEDMVSKLINGGTWVDK
ncbi:MAG: SDR family NAD(P)-dependent oxidoreductase [SAR202 cluster bacterium]|jgi:NAD(P)-dependent dehydrogenase (short-subunit alcohol dehydrogenase family)|nr:SDR family NAD(P)-dependent oxidoreductase [SAR202 cluster bacterium]